MSDFTVSTPIDTFMQSATAAAAVATLANGGTAVTAGQVYFAGTGGILQGNANFTTDGSNVRVGALGLQDQFAGTYFGYINYSDASISADRILTLSLSNANRTLTITGNSTINQDTSTVGSPTFAAETITGTGTAKFGATALASIGVSADTTAGVLTFTAPSAGFFSFVGGSTAVASSTGAAFTGTNTATSGANIGFNNPRTYNQATGTAANTDFKSYRTQTAVGSGSQSLADLGVGSTSWYWFGAGNTATTGGFNSSSTVEPAVIFAPIINQSGTAGYTALKVYSTETATGSGAKNLLDLGVGATSKFNVTNTGTFSSLGFTFGSGSISMSSKITAYNNVSTAGMGVGVVVAAPRQTAVTNATATLATYTVPAADSTYRISANVQVTAATTAAMTVVCTYTDETNTSRAQTLPFCQLAGTFLTSITNVTGSGPYEGATLHIRCKASTTIVFTTAGTVTGITYNVEGLVIQAA